MKSSITERQRDIYEFVRGFITTRGTPPTLREIGEQFGIRSTNGAEGHLAALERNGLILRERGKSRGIWRLFLSPLMHLLKKQGPIIEKIPANQLPTLAARDALAR